MECDWEGLHKNQSPKKLWEKESLSALEAFQFKSLDEFANECKGHFKQCLLFQSCWDASEPKLRSYVLSQMPAVTTNTNPEENDTNDAEKANDKAFLNFIKLFGEKMKEPNEVLMPYLWNRSVQDKDISEDEFADRIWNRWTLDKDETNKYKSVAMKLLLLDPADEHLRELIQRILQGDTVDEIFAKEITDGLLKQ